VLIAGLFIFAAVFLIVFALTGGFARPQVDVKKRMNAYIDTITADLEFDASHIARKNNSQPESFKKIRETLTKYGKKMEERGYTKQMELELQKGDIPMRGFEFILFMFGSTLGAILLLFLLNPDILSMTAAGVVGFAIPIIFLRVRQQQKMQKFSNQIGDTLLLISNSLKSGYGFLQSMDMVAKEMKPPIQTEFGRVLKEINLGMTTEDALTRLPLRVNSSDIDLVVTAMLIQRQIGGNLAEILDNISHTIRERIRIKGEIRTLTAQGRLSGLIIGALPIGIGLFLLMANPKYITQLFTDVRGQMMIGYAIIAEIVAILIIRKIINFKI
jgi:tight adherence protein B